MLHETARYSNRDEFVVVGFNPDDSGGGIIGTAANQAEANQLRVEALKQNYSCVRVRTWRELMK